MAPTVAMLATEANQANAGEPKADQSLADNELIPLECVCNLCDCGAHTCANFRPQSLQASRCSMRVEENNGNLNNTGATNNRCSKMGAHECQCLLRDERYLAGQSRAPSRFKSSDELKSLAGNQADDEELLHVLVTRPALAGKPRDNIVLEGDMDLRTTFETTYERLARMRLEHWKRCQEEKEEEANGKSLAPERRDEAQVSCVASDDRSRGDQDGTATEPQLATAELGDAATLNALDGNKTPSTMRADVEPPATNNFIDPDLSSIIVYDANLDRLQRVGLRKRSKYRPSTSLRPGGFGLFGDPTPPTATVEVTSNSNHNHHNHHHHHHHQQQQQQQQRPKVEEEPKRQLTTGELAMDARNLMHSTQSNRLVYSNINLPIDSKRKCRDNVNMIDHIKEQNIVEKRPQPSLTAAPQMDEKVSSVSDGKLAVDGPNNNYDEEDETNMRLLAQQEEAEVLEEIQRLTQSLPEQEQVANNGRGMNQSQGGATSYVRDAESRADDDMRRSRLHRTCQNQNFDIYNNDYRDTFGDPNQSSSNPVAELRKLSTRVSPVANNLFRESPDFIMTTTGKYLDEFAANKLAGLSLSGNIHNVYHEESRRESKQLVQEMLGENLNVEETLNENRQLSRTPCDQCRVLKLGDEFQYVGSKLGHNYFVEHIHQ